MTTDGVGEWTTTSFGVGRANHVQLLGEIHFPHSLGLLYSAFTYYTGFRVNSGEYKVMGLAPYGEPKYVDLILEHLMDLREDGSFHLDMKYFDYCTGMKMTNGAFDELFGGPARKPESKLTQREMDLAASVQVVTEMAMERSYASGSSTTSSSSRRREMRAARSVPPTSPGITISASRGSARKRRSALRKRAPHRAQKRRSDLR